MADTADPDGWMVTFNDLMGRIASRFGRIEPRRTATAYVSGLLSYLERKNCWNLAEHAGLTGPQAMQRLLRTACWEADAVRDDVRGYVIEQLGPGGVLIVDETGFVKKGAGSAGVQRQYTGTTGRIENSQVGVFPAYATARGRALVDRRLYLSEHSWLADNERCRATGVPVEVTFATKPALAAEMIAAALDAGLPARWVSGDEVYGQDPHLRGLSALAPLPRRPGRQGPTPVRLGLGPHRRTRTRGIPVAADPPQPDHRRARLLPLLDTHATAADGPGEDRGYPVGGGGVLPSRQGPGRAGPLPGTRLQSRDLKRAQAYLAALLLSPEPAPTVSAIAQSVGFKDPSHFSRAFRTRYGISPALYRRTAATPA